MEFFTISNLQDVFFWVVEFIFFAYLIQMTAVVLLKASFAITKAGEMSNEYFSNVTIFSILWSIFIMGYVI